jgi:hypothetical protein
MKKATEEWLRFEPDVVVHAEDSASAEQSNEKN